MRSNFILIIVVAMGAFLRLYPITSIPPNINWYGIVLSGTGLIIFTYLFINKMFKSHWLSLAAAFFIAISPPLILFSGNGLEANMALFLNVLGLYLFLKALERPGFFILSGVSFCLSLYSSDSSIIFVPVILAGLFLFFRKQIKISGSLFFLTALLMAFWLVFRLNFLAAFNLFDGKLWESVRTLSERYFQYLSPVVLFIRNDCLHCGYDLGFFSLYGLIFIPFGFFALLNSKEREKWLVLIWLFISILPAIFSNLFNFKQVLNLVFPIAVLEAFGFNFLINNVSLKTGLQKKLLAAIFLILVFANLALFLDFFLIHMPKEHSPEIINDYQALSKK